MGGVKGFWSDRRKGREDAQVLAVERLHELRQRSYEQLEGEARTEEVTGLSGEPYRRRTSVQAGTRGGEEELRVTVAVMKPSWLGGLNPLAQLTVIATPDGEMVGDYTLASEGNDPRRYRFPGES